MRAGYGAGESAGEGNELCQIDFLLSQIDLVLERADSLRCCEYVVKIGGRMEARCKCNFLHPELAVAKKRFRAFDAKFLHVAVEGLAGLFLEEPAEVTRSESHGGRDTLGNQGFGQMNADVLLGPIDRPMLGTADAAFSPRSHSPIARGLAMSLRRCQRNGAHLLAPHHRHSHAQAGALSARP